MAAITSFFAGWKIMLTGGEPAFHPCFLELAKENLLRLDTNNSLSLAKWQKFVQLVTPDRVDWIHCSLHPVDLANLPPWLKKLKFIMDAGYRVWVSWVGVSEVLAGLPELKRSFAQAGIPFVVNLLRTDKYPGAYTAAERQLIDNCSASALQRAMLDTNLRTSQGRPYPAGQRRIQVNAITGSIYRCFRDNQVMGNIYSGNPITLSVNPEPCPYQGCSYFLEHHLDTEGLFQRDLANILAGNLKFDHDLYQEFLRAAL
jgi:hypothetical protein